MRRIAISYRRADAASMAGRIFDELNRHFGDGDVFMDIDAIPFGQDFRTFIVAALKQAAVLVVIIGPRWLGAKRRGQYRIQDETDPVRLEAETALRLGIPVIPVLVEAAVMPKPADLPASLQDLPFLNAASIDSGRDFRMHLDRLIRSLESILANGPAGNTAEQAAQLADSATALEYEKRRAAEVERQRIAEAAEAAERRREAEESAAAERRRAAEAAEQQRSAEAAATADRQRATLAAERAERQRATEAAHLAALRSATEAVERQTTATGARAAEPRRSVEAGPTIESASRWQPAVASRSNRGVIVGVLVLFGVAGVIALLNSHERPGSPSVIAAVTGRPTARATPLVAVVPPRARAAVPAGFGVMYDRLGGLFWKVTRCTQTGKNAEIGFLIFNDYRGTANYDLAVTKRPDHPAAADWLPGRRHLAPGPSPQMVQSIAGYTCGAGDLYAGLRDVRFGIDEGQYVRL